MIVTSCGAWRIPFFTIFELCFVTGTVDDLNNFREINSSNDKHKVKQLCSNYLMT